jgi:regulator of RNase E activity RraA
MHPLDTFAPFRRWRPSPLRNLVYTFVWNSIIGVALAGAALLFGSRAPLGALLAEMLLVSNVVGFLIHGMVRMLRRVAPARGCC